MINVLNQCSCGAKYLRCVKGDWHGQDARKMLCGDTIEAKFAYLGGEVEMLALDFKYNVNIMGVLDIDRTVDKSLIFEEFPKKVP